jgi:hypothetical protein
MPLLELGVLLCTLAANGDTDALEGWLAAGADINARDYDGRTALHVATAWGSIPVVKLLLAQKGEARPHEDGEGGGGVNVAVEKRVCRRARTLTHTYTLTHTHTHTHTLSYVHVHTHTHTHTHAHTHTHTHTHTHRH